MLATKKDLDLEKSEEGKDYYVRIKDVIERINQRQNAIESTAADRFRRAISKPDFRRLSPRLQKLDQGSHTLMGSPKLDLSWKDGGKSFPKKSSSVGDEYQVSNIAVAGSSGEINNPSSDT